MRDARLARVAVGSEWTGAMKLLSDGASYTTGAILEISLNSGIETADSADFTDFEGVIGR